jgi:hypothetical protein
MGALRENIEVISGLIGVVVTTKSCEEVYLHILSRFVIPGIVFILTLAFGFWLSRSGRPYNGLLFNIHQLIAPH